MNNQNQNQNQNESPTTNLNNHVSAEDLKKIRGGISAGNDFAARSRVEKSDEDFAAPSV